MPNFRHAADGPRAPRIRLAMPEGPARFHPFPVTRASEMLDRFIAEVALIEADPSRRAALQKDTQWIFPYRDELLKHGRNPYKLAWLRVPTLWRYSALANVVTFLRVELKLMVTFQKDKRRPVPDANDLYRDLKETHAWLQSHRKERQPTLTGLLEIASFELGFNQSVTLITFLDSFRDLEPDKQREILDLIHSYAGRLP